MRVLRLSDRTPTWKDAALHGGKKLSASPGKAGRRPIYDWPGVEKMLRDWFAEEGLPRRNGKGRPVKECAYEKMRDWFSTRGGAPEDNKMLRPHLTPIWKEFGGK